MQRPLIIFAIVCTITAAISLPMLSDDAWKMAAVLSTIGLLCAAASLRSPKSKDRKLLWVVTFADLAIFTAAICSRTCNHPEPPRHQDTKSVTLPENP